MFSPFWIFFKTIRIILFQDYPSVGQIIQKARENNINIIFVIGGSNSTAMKRLYYDRLAAILPGEINNASVLSMDASDIRVIVGDNYRV
jgi:hypothetical protein